MTIAPQITSRGKAIHHLSLNDLIQVVESGERLRALCPIHGSDHQRSLSIDRTTGWGFCHCCHATVLVEAITSWFSDSVRTEVARGRANGRGPVVRRMSPMSAIADWQREEVAALRAALPLARQALACSARVQRYLAERGIPTTVALTNGMGYLSRTVWEQLAASAAQHLLKRWIGRLLFPLSSPYGEGFIGRTLLLWEAGMDENAHKALLERPGAPRRWIKTNPAGWFGADARQQGEGPLLLVEGGFDRLALLAAEIPAASVLALVGTAARPSWLRQLAPQITQVVLALDADESGEARSVRWPGSARMPTLSSTIEGGLSCLAVIGLSLSGDSHRLSLAYFQYVRGNQHKEKPWAASDLSFPGLIMRILQRDA